MVLLRQFGLIRRGIGVTSCLALPALFGVSFIYGLGTSGLAWFDGKWPLFVGGAFACMNLYLSHVRAWLHRWKHGTLDGSRFISGVPLFGTVALLLALVVGWGAVGTSLIGFALCFVDTLSPVWFLIATWRDKSFWDGPLEVHMFAQSRVSDK